MKSRIIQTSSNLQTKKLIYQQEISNLRKNEAEIKGQFAENLVNMRYKSIKAPVSGLVFDLRPKNVGYSAQMTESILKISKKGLEKRSFKTTTNSDERIYLKNIENILSKNLTKAEQALIEPR